MATKTCPACGYKVSAETVLCPKCGAKPKQPMGRLQVIAIIIFVGFVLNSIVPSSTPAVPARAEPVPPNALAAISSESDIPRAFRERKPTITDDERVRILAAATKSLTRKRDKMEGVTFYLPAGSTYVKTGVGAYIGIADGGGPYLRMKAAYLGDRWVFFEKIKIMADDEIVFEKVFHRSEITRDNEAGDVWEVADYNAGINELVALTQISNAKSATIRFSGKDRLHDHKIGSTEKARLKSVLTAYADLKKKL